MQPKIVEAWALTSVPAPAHGETTAGTAMAVPARDEATAAAAMAVAPAVPALPAGEATVEDMVNSVAVAAIAAVMAEAGTPWEPMDIGTIFGTPAGADALPHLAEVRPVQQEQASLGDWYEWTRRRSGESRVVRRPDRREIQAKNLCLGH
jgi:hypothetical protein